jgi:hypothetical protein
LTLRGRSLNNEEEIFGVFVEVDLPLGQTTLKVSWKGGSINVNKFGHWIRRGVLDALSSSKQRGNLLHIRRRSFLDHGKDNPLFPITSHRAVRLSQSPH